MMDIMDQKTTPNKRKSPYVPTYMNTANGPEICVVCGDAATGYHYSRMTCEGCKGFFRRTTQKNLKYICKANGNCPVDKTSRNLCPYCRYQKCLQQRMAVDLVLTDDQRKARRRLIAENRERRKIDVVRNKMLVENKLTDVDRQLIQEMMSAYQNDFFSRPPSTGPTYPQVPFGVEKVTLFADVMTSAISKLIQFSKKIPGFSGLLSADQTILLKASCLEIMIFRTAMRYNPVSGSIIFSNGLQLNQYNFTAGIGQYDSLLRQLFKLAVSLAKLTLDQSEVALLLGLLMLSADRPGLTDVTDAQKLEESLLNSLGRYVMDTYPTDTTRFRRIVVKIVELRTICAQHGQDIMFMKLDGLNDVPAMLFETMFEDGELPAGAQNVPVHNSNFESKYVQTADHHRAFTPWRPVDHHHHPQIYGQTVPQHQVHGQAPLTPYNYQHYGAHFYNNNMGYVPAAAPTGQAWNMPPETQYHNSAFEFYSSNGNYGSYGMNYL